MWLMFDSCEFRVVNYSKLWLQSAGKIEMKLQFEFGRLAAAPWKMNAMSVLVCSRSVHADIQATSVVYIEHLH